MRALRAHPVPHMFQNLWVSQNEPVLKRKMQKLCTSYSSMYRCHSFILLSTFIYSNRVRYNGFNKDQRARLVFFLIHVKHHIMYCYVLL